MPWPGVEHVLISDADARMPLSIIAHGTERAAQVSLALEAALAVVEREGWLRPT